MRSIKKMVAITLGCALLFLRPCLLLADDKERAHVGLVSVIGGSALGVVGARNGFGHKEVRTRQLEARLDLPFPRFPGDPREEDLDLGRATQRLQEVFEKVQRARKERVEITLDNDYRYWRGYVSLDTRQRARFEAPVEAPAALAEHTNRWVQAQWRDTKSYPKDLLIGVDRSVLTVESLGEKIRVPRAINRVALAIGFGVALVGAVALASLAVKVTKGELKK